jgi:hypothetical protein
MATPDPVGTSAGVTPLSHKAWTAQCALLLSAVLALAERGPIFRVFAIMAVATAYLKSASELMTGRASRPLAL